MRLEESKQISDIRPAVFRKNKSKKNFEKNLEDKNKNPYLCTTFRMKPIEKSSLRKLHIQQ